MSFDKSDLPTIRYVDPKHKYLIKYKYPHKVEELTMKKLVDF